MAIFILVFIIQLCVCRQKSLMKLFLKIVRNIHKQSFLNDGYM